MLPVNSTPIPRESARSAVYARLRQWIEEGQLKPDEVLRDAEIAAALGVSRTPVREALQMLEQHALVVTSPGRWTRVADASPHDARLIYPPLAALEGLAAELGCSKATSEDIDEMRKANRRLLDAIEQSDADRARTADAAFHDVLRGLAANPFLDAAARSLRIHTKRVETLYFKEFAPARESYLQHNEIVSLVEAGDCAGAGALTRANYLRGQNLWEPDAGEPA